MWLLFSKSFHVDNINDVLHIFLKSHRQYFTKVYIIEEYMRLNYMMLKTIIFFLFTKVNLKSFLSNASSYIINAGICQIEAMMKVCLLIYREIRSTKSSQCGLIFQKFSSVVLSVIMSFNLNQCIIFELNVKMGFVSLYAIKFQTHLGCVLLNTLISRAVCVTICDKIKLNRIKLQ